MYILDNVTEVTKIIGCDESFYKTQNNTTDPYYESTIYLVNTGVTIEDVPYTDLYYGSRKVSDLMVVKEYPGTISYPNDKIYLQPTVVDSKVTGYQLYFKHKDIVVPISSSASISYVGDNQDGTISVTWTTTEGEIIPTKLILATDKGLPDNIIQDVYNQIYSKLVESDNVIIKWKSIKSIIS